MGPGLRRRGGLQDDQVVLPGKGKGDAWEDGVVLQVPLYAYALAKK